MASRITTRDIDSNITVFKNVTVTDAITLGIWIVFTFTLENIVHDSLRLPFIIFSISMGIFLVCPSLINKQRRNYESIYILLTKDVGGYRPYFGGSDEKEKR